MLELGRSKRGSHNEVECLQKELMQLAVNHGLIQAPQKSEFMDYHTARVLTNAIIERLSEIENIERIRERLDEL